MSCQGINIIDLALLDAWSSYRKQLLLLQHDANCIIADLIVGLIFLIHFTAFRLPKSNLAKDRTNHQYGEKNNFLLEIDGTLVYWQLWRIYHYDWLIYVNASALRYYEPFMSLNLLEPYIFWLLLNWCYELENSSG